jgi:hypothetical protein
MSASFSSTYAASSPQPFAIDHIAVGQRAFALKMFYVDGDCFLGMTTVWRWSACRTLSNALLPRTMKT